MSPLHLAAALLLGWISIASAQEGTPPPPTADPFGAEKLFVEIASRVEPGVVSVRRFTRDDAWFASARGEKQDAGWRQVSEEDLLYPGFRPGGGGTGFLIDEVGHILTLNRVVVDPETGKGADLIDVEVEGNHFPAEIVGQEPTIDLAILQLQAERKFPHLTLGNSGTTRAGQWVLAFGNPPGPERTLEFGLVAYEPSRDCYQDQLSATYLQTSLEVPPASLGGPLVNLKGEVIGINTRRSDSAVSDSTLAASGVGYALPINLATAIYQSILFQRSKRSPWLGISVLLLTPEKRKELGDPRLYGILIDNVFDPSPATAAGVQVGDVLQMMNRQKILTVYDFQRWTYSFGIGAPVELGIVRKGKPMVLKTVIAERPPQATTR